MKAVFEKIKERLEEEQNNIVKQGKRFGKMNRSVGKLIGLAIAKRIIREVAEEYVPDINAGSDGWIPVEECLPDNCKYILLSFANFSVPSVGRYEEGAFYVGDEEDSCVSQGMLVDAWQPLPEQYRKGE